MASGSVKGVGCVPWEWRPNSQTVSKTSSTRFFCLLALSQVPKADREKANLSMSAPCDVSPVRNAASFHREQKGVPLTIFRPSSPSRVLAKPVTLAGVFPTEVSESRWMRVERQYPTSLWKRLSFFRIGSETVVN
jgi:hypothetical protein